jgi:alanyl-tRNA synthetase
MKAELKIIADHLRSSCFLIADGIIPSNDGRGYVLRRIMRRAMLQIHKLGAKKTVMHLLVDNLIKEMGLAYPELMRAKSLIIEILKNEEEKFRETLEKGLKILEEEITKTKAESFSGEIAFRLYDTYGFPLDLTQDILKEKNLIVNLDEFNLEMEKQKERARKSWLGSGEEKEERLFFDLKEKFGETKFLGYETLSTQATVLVAFDDFIILDQTPFYATSGGQAGDDGKIFLTSDHSKFALIKETKKFAGGLFVHFFAKKNNYFETNSKVTAEVNKETRLMKTKNHSATHLMHKALKIILGDSVTQKGSSVEAKCFTFDFNLNRAMSEEEINKVEDLVNSYIQQNSKTSTKIMSIKQAHLSGAEALFGEKYDDEVRVVNINPSIELCGGTHINATGEIGVFKIISEKGIASGIRRIEAITGFEVIEYHRKKEAESKDREENFLQEVRKKEKEIEKLKKQILLNEISDIKEEKINDKKFIYHIFQDIDSKSFKEISLEIKNKYSTNSLVILFAKNSEFFATNIMLSHDLLEIFNATNLLKSVNIKGGGKPDFATGGGIRKEEISNIILKIKEQINS